MSPAKKRILFAVMAAVLLLSACAPASAPAATKDPELVPIEQTVDALMAQNDPPVDGRAPEAARTPTPAALGQSVNPVFVVQDVQGTQTLTPTVNALQETVIAMSTTQVAQSTSLAEQASSELDPLFGTPTQEPFLECRITILRSNGTHQTFRLPPRWPLLDLKKGSGIIILHPVNLRSGPTLTHRILLTLRPDPSTVPYDRSDPNPTPTLTPRPEIIFKVIGGPAYTTIGDETGDEVSFSVSGRKYKWWQIELPNKTTGWIVEASSCGQIPFIAKAY
jgi:hypothetical protein